MCDVTRSTHNWTSYLAPTNNYCLIEEPEKSDIFHFSKDFAYCGKYLTNYMKRIYDRKHNSFHVTFKVYSNTCSLLACVAWRHKQTERAERATKTSKTSGEAARSLGERQLRNNLVPRAFSSTIFKMADRREKTLAKAGSRGTKISKNLGDFYHVTF